MRYLITGAFGFIATHLIRRLLDCDPRNEIIAYGLKDRNTLQYFPELYFSSRVQKITDDILNTGTLEYALRDNIDVVIHCAAIAGVSNYHTRPADTAVANGIGTFNVIDLCHKNKISKTIILSSSEVYGDSKDSREISGSSILSSVHNLRLTYSISKLFGDQLVTAYSKQYGMDICSIRPYGIWGPAQCGESVAQIFIRRAVFNKDIPVVLPGTQTRDFCYIDDFIDAVIACISSDKVNGQIINIGDPRNYFSVLDFAKKVLEMTNSKSKIVFIDRTDVRDTKIRKSDISLAKKLINFEPKTNLDKAIQKTAEWYRKYNIGEDMTI